MRTWRTGAGRLVAIGLLAGAAAGCGHASVSMPPAGAASDVVLDTYLQALVAGDCTTARALEVDQLAGQCDTSIHGYVFDHTRPFSPSPDSVQYVGTVTLSGAGGGLDGDHTWFFWLARQPGGDWRVSGGGTGP